MIANEETWRRGVVLSFASALLQALVAVVFVGIAAALLNATAATMKTAVDWIEIVSYALIMLIGVRLVWVKGRALIAEAHRLHSPKTVGAAATPAHQRTTITTGMRTTARTLTGTMIMATKTTRTMAMRTTTPTPTTITPTTITPTIITVTTTRTITTITATTPRPGVTRMRRSRRNLPDRAAGSGDCRRSSRSGCGLAPARSWCWCSRSRRACSGPASYRHLSWDSAPPSRSRSSPRLRSSAKALAGRFANTRSGYGMLAMRGIEVGAALVIVAFGALLLSGYIASERLL